MEANVTLLERHPKLYLPDGDIVLRAAKSTPPATADDGTRQYQLFRVHKFLLKYHSAPLGHMFADASVAPDEMYDGVPMVEMHGDRAEDLGMLLNYIYNPAELNFKRFDPSIPLVVSGAIRIADKYLIESLRDRLVKQVCADWPTTLQEWDQFDAELSVIRKNEAAFCELIPEPISAILFAQEFGCTQILPAAFYQLSRIIYGYEWDNAEMRELMTLCPLARWSLLDKDPANLVRCLRGFQELDNFYLDAFELLSAECRDMYMVDSEDMSEDQAEDRSPCVPFLDRLISLVWEKRRRDSLWNRDPLRFLQECINCLQRPELSKEYFPKGLCKHCSDSLRSTIRDRRRDIWELLPQYFNLT
ncbi:hypothetical protein L226DRAFT_559712 [Lentinus tigrinus ALCF2SS1-7]|uniref:BTB domain-containing protein n=1 Tax=Lentinus tigrinus ALCF2SS1-6 TaxID=1328759 RepID=A0A5C2S9R6_9APHY|nr:hypothetical protein L227DRAFT_525720 [Lentinus tigrinus ALCF2SS1-6]RPD75804.1 hypothetical protein L226DRAFT_559712 [Lentinus tigrinus ALCF2SS1-7]